jgi:hypothetical protein
MRTLARRDVDALHDLARLRINDRDLVIRRLPAIQRDRGELAVRRCDGFVRADTRFNRLRGFPRIGVDERDRAGALIRNDENRQEEFHAAQYRQRRPR